MFYKSKKFVVAGVCIALLGVGLVSLFAARLEMQEDMIRIQQHLDVPKISTDSVDTPISGYGRLYVSADGRLHFKNDTGLDWVLGVDGNASLGLIASATATTGERFGFTSNTSFITIYSQAIYIPEGVTSLTGKIFYDHKNHSNNTVVQFKIGNTLSSEYTHSGISNDVWSDEITMNISVTGWQTLEIQGKGGGGIPATSIDLRGWGLYSK